MTKEGDHTVKESTTNNSIQMVKQTGVLASINAHGEVITWRRIKEGLLLQPMALYFFSIPILFYVAPHREPWKLLVGFASYMLFSLLALVTNHRFFSHISFKTSRPFRALLACVACLGMQYGPLWWSCKHRRHHKHCDLPRDPHSWKQQGFFHSWMGWVMCREEREIEEEFLHPSLFVQDPKTGKKTIAWELVLIDRFFWVPLYALVACCYWAGMSPENVFIFIWFAAHQCILPILLFNVMFHPHEGLQPNKFGCYGTNNPLDPLTYILGETDHEDHHIHPARAHRNTGGLFDLSWWLVLKPLLCMGLIWAPVNYEHNEKVDRDKAIEQGRDQLIKSE